MHLLSERKHPLVLAVDDDRSERYLVAAALERSGFGVETAASGQEALSLFASMRPDIVLLDVDMPAMDGFDTCRALRGLMEGRYVPVVMVTGLTDETSIDLAYEAGATDFITKPLNWVILGRRLRYQLRAARAFRENAALLQALPDTIYRISAQGVIVDTNHEGERPTFFETPHPVGRRMEDLLPDQTAALLMQAMQDAYAQKKTQTVDLRLSTPPYREFEVRIEALYKGDSLAIVRDLTPHRRTERLTARLARVLDHASNEIYIFEAAAFRIVQVNWRATENAGYPRDVLETMTIFDIMPGIAREQLLDLAEPLWHGEQSHVTLETKNRRADGSLYPVEVLLHLSSEELPPVYVAVVQDITERQKANERIRHLAYYDQLTNLPNRALFHENLRYVLRLAKRHNHQAALLFIDIDRFKCINDTLGHTVGDLLLQTLAGRLSACLRDSDMLLLPEEDDLGINLARLGGDEFIVLLSNIAKDFDPARVARRIMAEVAQPCMLDGHEVTVTPSIGIAVYPRDGEDIESLLKHADVAMYNAKQKGKNNYQFYMNAMNDKALDRLRMEAGLRRAVENNELMLYYQPQVDPDKRSVVGLEALVRWNHPERGLVSPAEFIPLAEETGLIISIGTWVLETACRQASAWAAQGFENVFVSVNVSSRQFSRPEFTDTVADILARTGVNPRLIGLEMTESTIMSNAVETVDTLHALKRMGLRLSVDDFGTGYSSLSYLKRFPIDFLKIDRSFIGDLTAHRDDARLVFAIINMAHSLKIGIVAEGVETADQLHILQTNGARDLYMQGYLFAHPEPSERAGRVLAQGVPFPEVAAG